MSHHAHPSLKQPPYQDRSALLKEEQRTRWTGVCEGAAGQEAGGSLEYILLQERGKDVLLHLMGRGMTQPEAAQVFPHCHPSQMGKLTLGEREGLQAQSSDVKCPLHDQSWENCRAQSGLEGG